MERLEELATVEHVLEVEGPHGLSPQLNYSVPKIHTDASHDETHSRKGYAVVVGVIDRGIDWRHPDFIRPDGKTSRVTSRVTYRILALWDQVSKPKPRDHDRWCGFGPQKFR